MNNTRIEYHPSLNYPSEVYHQFTDAQKAMLKYDKKNGTVSPCRENSYGGHNPSGGNDYDDNNSNKRSISQVIQDQQQLIWELQSQASQRVPEHVETVAGPRLIR